MGTDLDMDGQKCHSTSVQDAQSGCKEYRITAPLQLLCQPQEVYSFRPNIHTEVKQNLMQILGQNLDQVLQKPDITTNVVSKVLTHYVAAVI